MRLLRYSLLVVLVVALCALLVPAASFSGPIEDCADDGQLQGNYSDEEKRNALKNLPSDLSEYSDCGEVLNTPNPKGSGGGSGSGSGSGSSGGGSVAAGAAEAAKPSAAELARERRERAAIERLANGQGKPSLELNGKSISPGDAGLYDLASATHAVPTSIKLALWAVCLLTVAGLVLAARRRFPGAASRLAGPLSQLKSRVSGFRS